MVSRRIRRADGSVPAWVTIALATAPALAARFLVGYRFFNFEQLIAMVVAASALVLLARKPAPAAAALVVVVPLQLLVSSGLYALGLPGGLTRMLALWKELVVLALVVAAWWRSREVEGRLDGLDRVAVAFVALGTLYLVLPELVASEQGAALSLDARFVAWRATALPAVLLLACRRLRPTDGEVRALVRGATVLGVVLGAIALVELVASDWWNRTLVDTLGVNTYRSEVLDQAFTRRTFSDIRVYGLVAGREIIRVGGPVVSHLTFSFLLLVALGVLVERLVRRDGGPVVALGVAGCGLALLLTQTRSAIVGACILRFAALRPALGRRSEERVRYAVLGGLVLLVAVPLALGAGLADRFTEGDEQSDPIHELRIDQALDTVLDHPFGLGLGMGAVAPGQIAPGAVTAENQLLDTSIQLGLLGGALFGAQYVLLLLALPRAADRGGPAAQVVGYGVRGALLGLLVPLWFLQPFALLEVSWLLFAMAGFALGPPAPDPMGGGAERADAPRALAALGAR